MSTIPQRVESRIPMDVTIGEILQELFRRADGLIVSIALPERNKTHRMVTLLKGPEEVYAQLVEQISLKAADDYGF